MNISIFEHSINIENICTSTSIEEKIVELLKKLENWEKIIYKLT